jgi:hypothetical protein
MGTLLKFRPGPQRLPSWGRPRIDWGHQLTNGLIGCWTPGIAYGRDLTGATPDLGFSSSATFLAGLKMTEEGPALNGLKSGGFCRLTGLASPAYTGWTELTLAWRGYFGPSADNAFDNTDLIGIDYNNVNGTPFAVASLNNNGGNVNLFFNSGGTFKSTSNTAITNNAMQSFAGTFPVGGTCRVYKNGVDTGVSLAFGASAPNVTATTQISLSAVSNQTARYVNALTTIACAWSRILSADEIAAFHYNPYQFIITGEGEMPSLFVAAAAPVVTGGNTLPLMGVG